MIIVTGASKGIGKYIFDHFLSIGENVIGTFNSTSASGENMEQVDVSSMDSVEKFYTKIAERIDRLTLINCAGISYTMMTHKSDPLLWKKVIDVNLTGTYNVIRTFLPKMREQKYGRIINFSSVVAMVPTAGVSAYAASKAGLI